MTVHKPYLIRACRTFHSACLFLCLAAGLLLPSAVVAAGAFTNEYAGELQRLAREKGLARERL